MRVAWGHALAAGLMGMLATTAQAQAQVQVQVQVQTPDYYPAGYKDIAAAAGREGKLVIYGTNKVREMQPVLADFGKLYPAIAVDYNEMNSVILYNRILSEAAAGGDTADLSFTSASELHLRLAKEEGLALAYASPEASHLKPGNVWQGQLWNYENEPVCNLYNTAALPADRLPRTRADLRAALTAPASPLNGRIVTYDVESSGVALALAYRDSLTDPDFWKTPLALGAAGARFFPGAFIMSEKVGTGESLIAYNLPCQVLAALQGNQKIGNFFFTDYTLMSAQTVMISKAARHPNAARLYLDYLLSERGQTLYGSFPGIYPVREGTPAADMAGLLKAGIATRPATLDDDLLKPLDPAIRAPFLSRWKQSIRTGAASR